MDFLLARFAAWALVAVIVFVTLGPIRDRPTFSFDPQLERAIAFFALGFAFSVAYPRRRVQVAVGVLACAFVLEAGQRLTTDRHGHLHDALAKAVGGILGILAVDIAQRLAPSASPAHHND